MMNTKNLTQRCEIFKLDILFHFSFLILLDKIDFISKMLINIQFLNIFIQGDIAVQNIGIVTGSK